jgi:hypothetical protein
VLTCIALLITVNLIWFGRKKLLITIPCALIFLFLAAIAIPSFIRARPIAFRNACINNLRLIRDAKIEWASVNHKLPTDIPTFDELCGTNNLLRRKPICQSDGTYTIRAVNEKPKCSLAEQGHRLK